MNYRYLLPCVLLLTACSRTTEGPSEEPLPETPPTPRTVMVHLFEWPWDAVAEECERVLGPQGFAAVQVSPPQEHHVGPQWWVRYQPVSYVLESRGGDEAAFTSMVQRCAEVGVDIYVDAVINHMTGVRDSGVGSAGTEYGRYSYPPLYGYDDFNHCGLTEDDDIVDFGNAEQLQDCELVNLADLDTASTKVRETLADYLNALLNVGVAGFRVDAAKHMPPDDLEAIFSMVGPEYYLFLELAGKLPETVDRADYVSLGAITEFEHNYRLEDAFKNGAIDKLHAFGPDNGMANSVDAVVFVDNHDTQREAHGLSYKDGELYELANVFMLANPYGYPKLMSSFDFAQRDQGAPASPPLAASGDCNEGWICEHRRPDTLAMVAFRNAARGAPLTGWQRHGETALSFGRADRGHVLLNIGGDAIDAVVRTRLADGRYCNILENELCVDVNGGEFTTSLGGQSALVLQDRE